MRPKQDTCNARQRIRAAVQASLWGAILICVVLGPRPVGADGRADASSRAGTTRYFETHIAPLLARHCLDCHDSGTKDGDLDLSGKSAALAGGESGPAIVPGKSAESLLWDYVESDEMPQNRAPLSDDEKQQLRQWIDAGAVWSLETIDVEAYLHDTRAADNWLQRLTVPEYIETVRSAVGIDISTEAQRILPRDQRADGFTNTAYNLGVDLEHVQAYSRLAKIIVSRMDVVDFAAQHAPCDQLDDGCMRELVSHMGKWLLRGPLSDQEVSAYLTVAESVAEAGGDYAEAVGFVIQAMLQSPRFIYRIEQQRGDGAPRPVDDYELASRLSYMLWGAPPDKGLMEVAERGGLGDPSQMESQVQRMLEDPRAIDRSLQFIHEWVDLNRLDSLRPNPERFPQWNDQLARDMQAETRAFFEDLVWKEKRPLADLMNAPFTYATPRLAYHYGLYEGAQQARESAAGKDEATSRFNDGLQVLYTFDERRGETIHDVSEAGEPLDLTITDPGGASWQADGLNLHSSTLITSEQPPTRLIDALKKSGELTLEAWITPGDTTQSGPARMVTLSNGIGARNFTLGQSGDRFECRLRTTETSGNGEPSLSSESSSVMTAPQHVVYTRDAQGVAAFYVDGRRVGRDQIEGDFSNWDNRFHLALGNELSGDRRWQGKMHLVAIYDRALSVDQVRQNHAAGGGLIEDELDSLVVADSWDRSDTKDLIALYRFDEGEGEFVRDQSQAGESLDLKIENPAAVKWSSEGMTVYGSTRITTDQPPQRMIDAIKQSKALTVEAWITPANATQDGPARIVTLSSGAVQRNVTIGQDGQQYEARLRAARTDANGLPPQASASGSAETRLTHLVYTKDPSGQAKLFVNGEQQASADVGEDLGKWDSGFRLGLANETTQDRPWRGTYHLVAIYNRPFSQEEIQAKGAGLSRFDLDENSRRGGLLTQGSVLTIGGDEASMVTRGLFVLHDLLYSRVGNPPPCVDTNPVPTKPGMSMRDLAEARLADSSCTGCHVRFEPLAFGLEKFDGIGAYHEVDEHGNELREDGEILFPGESEPVAYKTSGELMDLLAGSERVHMAITRKATQFALGRPLIAADLPHLHKIHAVAQEQGGTYQALMTALVMSDLVRMTRTESEQSTEAE